MKVCAVVLLAAAVVAVASAASCGDGVCHESETWYSCKVDCPPPAPFCNDGVCNNGETCVSCPVDCGACVCGDGVCQESETAYSCAQDCPSLPVTPGVPCTSGTGFYCVSGRPAESVYCLGGYSFTMLCGANDRCTQLGFHGFNHPCPN